jgi:C-methyltransferase-like protein/methyltransferase family protein/putative zinc binding protein
MRRTACSACGHTDLETFLNLGDSPIADAYTDDATADSPVFPLEVAVCGKCRLVQLLEVVDADILFGSGYSFYTSASPPLSAYHAIYAEHVLGRHPVAAARGVVEVGCNDGDFLRHFTAYPTLGVDPAAGPARAATERGLEVQVRPFGLAAAHNIREHRGRQGLIIANHVLAHVADVADVLAGIAALLDERGTAMIEVQYLPDLIVNNAFDLVYHEHRNFFSLHSLESAAARHGLHIVDAQLTDRQGGSLRVTAGHQPGTDTLRLHRIRASETWLQQWGTYTGIQGRVERIRTRLIDLVGAAAAAGVVAGYGAPAKATTLLNFCGLTANKIQWVVDTTAAKQGRHIPGTRIPIVDPDTAPHPDTYLLLAHNYARTIMSANPGRRWIVPIPAPVVL